MPEDLICSSDKKTLKSQSEGVERNSKCYRKLFFMWRIMPDYKYFGYAIQKKKRLLFWTWWSNEYLCIDFWDAARLLEYLNLKS